MCTLSLNRPVRFSNVNHACRVRLAFQLQFGQTAQMEANRGKLQKAVAGLTLSRRAFVGFLPSSTVNTLAASVSRTHLLTNGFIKFKSFTI